MMKYICVGMVLVGAAAVMVLIMLSTSSFSWLQVGITLLCIIAALVLSFLAIRSIGRGDEEARLRYPIWDTAMANWNRLQYCSRDKVIFDPKANKVLNDASVSALLSMDQLDTHGAELHALPTH
jgi:heme exporter protein D